MLCVDEVWYSPCFSERLQKKYVPLVFHLDIVVIMLLIYDHIMLHCIMYNLCAPCFPSGHSSNYVINL